jgi:hypothetical protein
MRRQRRDSVAGVGGLELRNVDANYLFERSHRFAGIQPNSGFGDSAALGIRSSGRDACAGDTSRASAGRIALERVLRLVPPTLSIRFDEHVATNFA